MKNLPKEIQEHIASTLDPKSRARLRTVSREMKSAVNATELPTGSYQKKTGRFQKRFGEKGMHSCLSKMDNSVRESGIALEDMSIAEMYSTGRIMWRVLKKSYRKNRLLEDFRHVLREKTEPEFVKEMLDSIPGLELNRSVREDLRQEWKREKRHHKDYRRRVIRLIKAWAKTDKRYRETLELVRRRTKPYTLNEEKMHKDRLMDAIIVQTLVISHSDDPTKPIPRQDGTLMTLDEKINRLVKQCRSRYR